MFDCANVIGNTSKIIPLAFQILKILQHSSVRGLSVVAFELEVVGYTIALAYCLHKGLPFSAYGELAFLLIQGMYCRSFSSFSWKLKVAKAIKVANFRLWMLRRPPSLSLWKMRNLTSFYVACLQKIYGKLLAHSFRLGKPEKRELHLFWLKSMTKIFKGQCIITPRWRKSFCLLLVIYQIILVIESLFIILYPVLFPYILYCSELKQDNIKIQYLGDCGHMS